MASAIRQMTGVGGDVRKIARLLQKKAPPGHMLAYINQEEADLLKARGGSGKPHEDTGVPSFEEEYTEFDTLMPIQQEAAPVPQGTEMDFAGPATQPSVNERYQQAFANRLQKGSYMPYGSFTPAPQSGNVAPLDLTSGQAAAAPAAVEVPMTDATSGYYRPYYAESVAPAAAAPVSAEGTTPFAAAGAPREGSERGAYLPKAPEPSFFEGMTDETKKRLGIAGIQGLVGAYQSQQAAEQGRKAKEEIQRLAQPYQEQGRKLIAQAQSGELTPAAQQTLQAAQAQAAQGAQARGGVGAQQAQAQVEALRQQLLQNQYDYGLKVSGIGDNIATGAIRTGLEADRYVNQLTSSYFTNIARTAYGQAPQVAGSPTYVRAET
jgi:hypothetical protein